MSLLKMIYLAILLTVHFTNCERIIQTNSGPISGIAVEGKNVDAFLGIPYAEPPVGNLRFARPVPKSPWEETLNANELPPACVQFSINSTKMDEDCLYLNLWVSRNGSQLRPMMIFVYGSAFLIGSTSWDIYNGAELSQHGDVIVASMNYRVGTLGFFSAFTDEAAGSMGMYDQLLAMQWLKDNAESFGGDPDNILIFGQGFGAVSVSFHIISPLSKNLFKRAILESGASIHPAFCDDNEALRTGSEMASIRLGCALNNEELKENSEEVVKCMKNLPAEKFAEIDSIFVNKFITGKLLMVPRVGDEFLPDCPSNLFQKGEYEDTEVLFGITRDEGSLYVLLQLDFLINDTKGKPFDPSTFNETLAEEIINFYTKNEQTNKIIQKYFKKVEDDANYTYLNAVIEIISDALIICGTVFQADFQSLKGNPVYFYLFEYRSPFSPYPEWVGVPHFSEVRFVFGKPVQPYSLAFEELLSKDIMDIWATFAKTGDPNIHDGLFWPKYTYNNSVYQFFGGIRKIGVRPDSYRCEEWREFYKSTINDEVIQNLKNTQD